MSSCGNLDSFGEDLNVVIFGGTGGIGQALMHSLSKNPRTESIFAISRSPNDYFTQKVTTLQADIGNEDDDERRDCQRQQGGGGDERAGGGRF